MYDETGTMFWVNDVPRECVFLLPTLRKVYAATDFVGLSCSNKYVTIFSSKQSNSLLYDTTLCSARFTELY